MRLLLSSIFFMILIQVLPRITWVTSFTLPPYSYNTNRDLIYVQVLPRTTSVTSFTLPQYSYNPLSVICFMNSPKMSDSPKRLARRDLKKKRVRDGSSRNIDDKKNPESDYIWVNSERRPLLRSQAIEAGTDYWLEEKDLQMSLEQEKAIRNRKALEGEIPKEKLRTEVVAPYKQNWIGYMSVGVVILATIIRQFPELLQSPIIPIPDL